MLRDTNRTIQLRLRDIEVANDDIERQARHTSSSLEDLESKYNVAIERGVMLEAEIQAGEQERESLRIETQRLRDELADLRIEAEITQGKLRRLEMAAATPDAAPRSLPAKTPDRPRSSPSEPSPTSTASSPTRSTPPPKSAATSVSETPTPPSPPMSEASARAASTLTTPHKFSKPRLPSADANATPRPAHYQQRLSRQPHGPPQSLGDGGLTPGGPRRISSIGPKAGRLPSSSSLRQIRGLIGQVQRLEQRVQSARSKLPGPAPSPLGASPQNLSTAGAGVIPASITVRSHRKRTGGSITGTGSIRGLGETTPRSTNSMGRPSFGIPTARSESRPSSRASASSHSSFTYPAGSTLPPRPSSRTGMTGARTPLGYYSTATMGDGRRPRSSVGGSYASVHGHSHSHSMSVSGIDEKPFGYSTPTPRRSTLSQRDAQAVTGIPTPSGLSKRLSGGSTRLGGDLGSAMGTPRLRKTSSQAIFSPSDRDLGMGPPERKKRLSGVGET